MDAIASAWLEGALNNQGHVPPPKDPPKDLLEASPPRPHLQLLTWGDKQAGSGLGTIQVPKELVTKWTLHPQYSAQFNAFLDDLPVAAPGGRQDSEEQGSKREFEETAIDGMTRPQKAPKLDIAIMDASSISAQKLAKVHLSSFKGQQVRRTLSQPPPLRLIPQEKTKCNVRFSVSCRCISTSWWVAECSL